MPDGSYRIERYRRTRYFALYDKEGLIAVTTYRNKGANAVKERLEAQDGKIEELQARLSALIAADLVPSLLDTFPAPSRNGGASHHEEREPLWFPL